MHMTKLIITAASMMLAATLTPAANAHCPPEPQSPNTMLMMLSMVNAGQPKLGATKDVLRDLWIGHVFWIRNVVVASLMGDVMAQQTAEKQVAANAQSIADAVEPFYGAAAKKQLFTLLDAHYGAVKAYFDASIAKDDAKQSEAMTKLMSNAAEIAVFLNSINPYLPKDDVEGLLQAHGGHHIAQIQQLLTKDYAGEAQTWADMTQHMYVVADAIAEALAKQFPKKF